MIKVQETLKPSLPKISIVIPSFNKADYIGYTLESIVSQNYPNLEIIVQDGGSKDGTEDIIKNFEKRYPGFLCWFSEEDGGQLDAINKGLKKASGDILTFINADDIYLTGAFHCIADAFKKNPKNLWFAGRCMLIDENGRELSLFFTRHWVCRYKDFFLYLNWYFNLMCVNYLMQPAVFISRHAYLTYGPFTGNSDFVLEYDFWLILGKVQMPMVINKTLAAFRLSKKGITSVQSRRLVEENYRIVKRHTKNPFILLVQNLNNVGRIFTISLIKNRIS